MDNTALINDALDLCEKVQTKLENISVNDDSDESLDGARTQAMQTLDDLKMEIEGLVP
jgi:hypothetical protein